MKKLLISLPDPLYEQVDMFIKTWGFPSKAEFFRYAAQAYLGQNERMMNARKMGIKLPLHLF